jgi:BCD family chlorophyll transporter-like MFS transporter
MRPSAPLSWLGIARLGLVQASIGSIVMLATSLLNRVMVVEYALPAAIPAGLVAWHYAVQLSRPLWGHGSDRGRRRTPWIIGGIGVLGLGALLAVHAVTMLHLHPWAGLALAVVGFGLIGAGVGAAGTSLLALLAARAAPERRSAAAAITWTMMVAGIAVTAGIAGGLLDPFTPARLTAVSGGVVLVAFLLTLGAVYGMEGTPPPAAAKPDAVSPGFRAAVRDTFADPTARRFTIFVFCSMLAYSMQDLILEPFSGLLFGFTPGESTQLSGAQHGGVLAGMILSGIGGSAFNKLPQARWLVGGCVGSGLALAGLATAAAFAPHWPLVANIVALGFANGVFAVAAVGAMIGLAGADSGAREGLRLGVWGAAQAVGFGVGGLVGAVAVDAGRRLIGSTPDAFVIVFGAEALLFIVAARLGMGAIGGKRAKPLNSVPVAV